MDCLALGLFWGVLLLTKYQITKVMSENDESEVILHNVKLGKMPKLNTDGAAACFVFAHFLLFLHFAQFCGRSEIVN